MRDSEYYKKHDRKCRKLADEMMLAAREGRLTEAFYREIDRAVDYGHTWTIRRIFTKEYSWLIPTEEWLDSMALAVKKLTCAEHPKVLEVCAGKGVLVKPMQKRGVVWAATDIGADAHYHDLHPPHVAKMEALEAVDKVLFDLLFVSWIPYESKLDYDLAMACYRRGKPMILVGEGRSGCTGSYEFWGTTQERSWEFDEDELAKLPEAPPAPWDILSPEERHWDWFKDIPVWDGIHDATFLVLPHAR